MKHILQTKYPDYVNQFHRQKRLFDCILKGRVFNLITKERYFEKPTYNTLTGALCKMKALCQSENIHKIAMPIIGCGLDRLEGTRFPELLKMFFKKKILRFWFVEKSKKINRREVLIR